MVATGVISEIQFIKWNNPTNLGVMVTMLIDHTRVLEKNIFFLRGNPNQYWTKQTPKLICFAKNHSPEKAVNTMGLCICYAVFAASCNARNLLGVMCRERERQEQ